MSEEKTPEETPGVELIPQPHGGALKRGPGGTNRGGPGRPKNAVREELLRILDEHGVPFVQSVLAGEVEGADVDDKLRAFESAARYALGTQKEITVEAVREKLGETIRIIREELGEDDAARVLSRVRAVWR